MKILLVDDDEELLIVFEQFLTNVGHTIAGKARNGLEAVKLVQSLHPQATPDVLIIDYRMPVKNGIEAIKEIFDITKDIKIIMISADPRIRQDSLNVGVAHFLPKPFSMRQLVKTIG